MTGLLSGVRVVDASALAPGPYATALLADLGADVVLIERPGGAEHRPSEAELRLDSLRRGKRSIVLDLKDPLAAEVVAELTADADVFVEGWRPGVAERLGLGHRALTARNPGLVYCSITGYGQSGPYRDLPGHDLNYLAASGLLGAVGRGPHGPVPPLNLLADYAGGGLAAAFAICAALFARERGAGPGEPLDVSMTDSVISMLGPFLSREAVVGATPDAGAHLLGGTHPLYRCYACADGEWLSVAALEHRFRVGLLDVLGRPDLLAVLDDPSRAEEAAGELAAAFATRSAAAWMDLLGHVTCVAPVHRIDRLEEAGLGGRLMSVTSGETTIRQPAGLPGFPQRPATTEPLGPLLGEHTQAVLAEIGYAHRDGVLVPRDSPSPAPSPTTP